MLVGVLAGDKSRRWNLPSYLCLAKTLRVRTINDFEANLRGALFVMIIRCLCAFDICFDGLSPSFVPEKNSF